MKPVLKIKRVVDHVEKVSYSKEGDAGIDLRASGRWVVELDSEKKEIEQDSYDLNPSERILIKTGIIAEIPKGFWGNIRDRSGLAFSHGIHILGGVVDETYRGEIGVVVVNSSKNRYMINKNDRIAQMIIVPYAAAEIVHSEDLTETSRGANGFGSSGKK